ncbi:MAG TPA: MFS transporter [Thermoanaerobaculia bacterium]|nr:MFS transporter [Thermoanaerobaculia bacterium]
MREVEPSSAAAVAAAAPSSPGDLRDLNTAAEHAAGMRQLWVLMATVFVDMIGAMMVLPLLPFYVIRFGARPSLVGPLIGTFFMAQLATSPLWGRLSDRYGRRPLILVGLLLSAVSYVLFGLAGTIWMLFLSRLVQGIGSGTVGVVQAYVSDSIAPEERAKALGWVTAAISAGVVIGPLIGSSATYLGSSAPGYLAAGLCVVNFLFASRWLPESRHRDAAPLEKNERGEQPPPRRSLRKSIAEVVREPTSPVASLIWLYAVGMMAFMAMNGVLALYLGRVYGVTEKTIGFFYTYVGAISLVMRAVLLGPAVRRFGEVGAMRLGTVALALGMAAIPLPAWLPMPAAARIAGLALVVLMVPVGTALLFPSTTALVSRRAPREETGQVMGVQQAFGGVARLLGPLWSTAAFGFNVNLPFWLAAGFMLGGGVLASTIQPEARDSRAQPRAAAPAAAGGPAAAAVPCEPAMAPVEAALASMEPAVAPVEAAAAPASAAVEPT